MHQKMQLVLLLVRRLSCGRNQRVWWVPSHPPERLCCPRQEPVTLTCQGRDGWWASGGGKAAQRRCAGEASLPCWELRAESSVEAGAAATDVARMMDKPQHPVKPAVKCLLTSGCLSRSLGINKREGGELSGSSRDVRTRM